MMSPSTRTESAASVARAAIASPCVRSASTAPALLEPIRSATLSTWRDRARGEVRRLGEAGGDAVAVDCGSTCRSVVVACDDPGDDRFDMTADRFRCSGRRVSEFRVDSFAARADEPREPAHCCAGCARRRHRREPRRRPTWRADDSNISCREFLLPLPTASTARERARSHAVDDLVRACIHGRRTSTQRSRRVAPTKIGMVPCAAP